jgi:thiol-disulfide isomerase/thioredoxin
MDENPGGQDQSAPGMPPPQERSGVSRGKVLVGAVLALALVVSLYFVNRFWIAPALKIQAKTSKEHPLAPDFSLTDISGKKLSLSDYRGKVLMLDFWATWCGPCRIEIPGFIELQKRYGSQGFAVVGISMDDGQEPVVDFYRQFNMNYPVALGNARLEELYGGIIGLPTTFLIGRDGRIYAKHEGATEIAVFEEEIKQLLALSADKEAVGFQREGEIRAVRRVREPVFDQLMLGRERYRPREVRHIGGLPAGSARSQFVRVKRIGRKQGAQQGAEFAKL